MRVYISGKIRNNPNYIEDFKQAEIWLKSKGYKDIINPTTAYGEEIENIFNDNEKLDFDLLLLSKCDAIFMAKNWQTSKGAKVELDFAKRHNKKIFYQELFGRNNRKKYED